MRKLLLLFILTIQPMLASADSVEEEIDGIYYELSDDDYTAIVIENLSGEYSGEIVIPESVNYEGTTYSVTKIGNHAFCGLTEVVSVTIPNSVTTIDYRAFLDCSGLTSITIPSSVLSIGESAFAGCSSLTSITIPDGVTSIDRGTFADCSSLASILFPCNLISIGEDAFLGCGLSSLTIPSTVTNIGQHAFAYCNNLTMVTFHCDKVGEFWFEGSENITELILGDEVTEIQHWAFSGLGKITTITLGANLIEAEAVFSNCTELKNIIFNCKDLKKLFPAYEGYVFEDLNLVVGPEVASVSPLIYLGYNTIIVDNNNPIYDSRDNCNAIIEKESNKLVKASNSTIIPNSVTSIGDGAFKQCSDLTSLTIPQSVTSIGYYAFSGCSGLKSIVSEITEPFAFDSYVFNSDIYSNATLYVPVGTREKYEATDGWKLFSNIVEMEKELSGNIEFADEKVKAICVGNWDTDGDGELSYKEAAAVKDLGTVFNMKMEITSFDELKYFTGLTSIGDVAFPFCSSLTSVAIPISVTSIGNDAFYGCTGLTSVTIPNGAISIGERAFQNCSGLISVTIGNSMTTIGNYAFSGCNSLVSLTIPKNVTSIGDSSFGGCGGLTSIVVEEGNSVYDSRGNCNAIIKTTDNRLILGCNNTVIPNNVVSIGDGAFGGCSGLTSIIIPQSVVEIGNGAFFGCNSLTSINLEDGNTMYSSVNGILFNKDKTTIILYPAGKTDISYSIPNSVVEVGDYAFNGCNKLTSVIIPNSVTSIGKWAFYGCSGLTSVAIPNSVICIGDYAFSGCSELASVTIPNSVTSIGSAAFQGCSGLTSMTIPNSVTIIGKYAFSNCSGLTSMTIPTSVTTIEDRTFESCINLTSVIIGNSVTQIGEYAFQSCYSLSSVAIGNNVTSIANWAFSDCRGLTFVEIPNCVTSIGEGAFHGCTYLATVTIGSSVTSIGTAAFGMCSNLKDVFCYAEKVPKGDTPFYSFQISANTTLHVPSGSIDDYRAANTWKDFKEIVAIMDLDPVEENEAINYGEGGDFTDDTDLTGTIVNNIYYNISTDAGGYSKEEGCIVITKETSDEQMASLEGLGITDEELKQNFTGIIFKVPAGSGKVMVIAETTGNMTLKVKVGSGEPMEMELSGRLKMKVPYTVSEESRVYIFAGTSDENAARGIQKALEGQSLKIYGIEWEQTIVKGDANEDGDVNAEDIVDIVNHSMDKPTSTGKFNEKAADVNKDGIVNVADIVTIVNGIISNEED